MGIRTTANSMEFPIAENGELLVSEEYVRYVVNYGNKKLEDNFRRIRTFFDAVWLLFWCNVDQAKHPGCARRSRSKGAS